jgi:hypothetical protein
MIRVILALFLILHGLVHLLWFIVPWHLMTVEGLPYSTKIVAGRLDIGDSGIRFVGLLWALATLAFIVAGVGLLFSTSWWFVITVGATLFSLCLSVLAWPDSRWSALIDILILAILLIGNQMQLSFLPFV